MKKIYSFILFISIYLSSYTQSISNYAGTNFSATSGTFTPIVGGTNVASSTSTNFLDDEEVSTVIPIGFTFYYMGYGFTQIRANSNGLIGFINIDEAYSNSLLIGLRMALAPLWDDLAGSSSSSAKYITTGSAGSRVFTLEYLNWLWNYNATNAAISFQVKLYEGTGRIEFVYRQESGSINNGSASIGLTGLNYGSGNFISLNNTSNSPVASTSTENDFINTKPATGQIYSFTPPQATVAAPTSVIASNVNGSSMLISWVDNSTNETNFNIQYSTNGVNFNYAGTVTSNTRTSTGTTYRNYIHLPNPSTTYTIRVVANSEGVASAPISITQATTACTNVSNVPYFQSFDGATPPNFSSCIAVQNVNGNNTWQTSNIYSVLPYYNFVFYEYNTTTAADDWFFLEPLNLVAGKTYKLRFSYASSNGPTFVEKLEVKYGSGANAAAMTSGTIFTNTNINFTNFTDTSANFTPTTSGVYYIGFRCFSDLDQAYLLLDDVLVTEVCVTPASVNVNNITSNAARINFTSTGNNFIAEYGLAGFTPGTGASAGTGGTIATGTSTPINVSGLLSNTTYDVYVRQVCNTNEYSLNSPKVSFTTSIVTALPIVDGLEDFKILPNPTKDKIVVQIKLRTSKNVSFRILNNIGQVVLLSENLKLFGSTTKELSLGHLPSGNYFLQTSINGEVFTSKLVKE